MPYSGLEEVFSIVSLPFHATQQCPVVAMVTQQCINSIKNSFCTRLTRNQLKSNTCLLTHWQSHNTPAPNEWMAKYKNSVADIEIPTIRTWNSASQINKVYRKVSKVLCNFCMQDDQEVLLIVDTSKLKMSASGSKSDLKRSSRPSSLKVSSSNNGMNDFNDEENGSLSCQVCSVAVCRLGI